MSHDHSIPARVAALLSSRPSVRRRAATVMISALAALAIAAVWGCTAATEPATAATAPDAEVASSGGATCEVEGTPSQYALSAGAQIGDVDVRPLDECGYVGVRRQRAPSDHDDPEGDCPDEIRAAGGGRCPSSSRLAVLHAMHPLMERGVISGIGWHACEGARQAGERLSYYVSDWSDLELVVRALAAAQAEHSFDGELGVVVEVMCSVDSEEFGAASGV